MQKDNSPFFNKIDWASFWTATALSFLVYFLTLGPSVGLEDSGELAVAGDHLGVPHPPGYPIWTIISFCFARLFSFVTFRGQPNPAWAISLVSAVFGALAAGCTAMLITRSAADMLASLGATPSGPCPDSRAPSPCPDSRAPSRVSPCPDSRAPSRVSPAVANSLLAWSGGVAGSLIFAFSPVMWSQSTIVEVYSLGAFFLMLVMLLTYRWMRRPSDKLLWITAFVFGLGLTNYQVLLLAALPLVVIIFLRNILLFRDFMVVTIPFGLSAMILKLGSLNQQRDLPKRIPIAAEVSIPSEPLLVAGAAAFVLALGVMVFCALRRPPCPDSRAPSPSPDSRALSPCPDSRAPSRVSPCPDSRALPRVSPSVLAAGVLLALALLLFALAGAAATRGVVGSANPANITLLPPVKYLHFAMLLAGILGLSAFAAAFGDPRRGFSSPLFAWPLYGAAALAVLAVVMALQIPAARLPGGIDLSTVPTLGVGTYHLGFIFGIAVMVALAATAPRTLLFAIPVAAIELVAYILVVKGAMLGLTHPTTWWFRVPVLLNFALLALATITLPNGMSVALTFLMAELGLSFYAYMPIVSDLRNPPMNWGYPRTWDGFKHAITRGQYEAIKPTNIFTQRFLHQVGDYFIDLRRQFTLLLAPFGFLPFAAWRLRRSSCPDSQAPSPCPDSRAPSRVSPCPDSRALPRVSPAVLAAGLLVLAAVLWGVDSFVAESAIPDGAAAVLRAAGALALVAAVAIAVLAGIPPMLLACVFIAASVLFVVLGNIPAIERVFDASRIDKLFTGGLLLIGGVGVLLIVWSQARSLALRALCALRRPSCPDSRAPSPCPDSRAPSRVSPSSRVSPPSLLFDDISQQWLIGTALNFLVMSVVLIMLANPKGDLQDTFIQKVKFISSHGLFALWIGYGLVFALVTLRRLPLPRAVVAVAAIAVLLTPLIPIEQNYFNERLVFELSGAEQNGHDYGWQFGNYQLRGAAAIREELGPDEEPLPNPLYPPEMGQGAVFFGGTDPGRFVPTYMIYSADVRPDVFLITQNALADNTFMSVTRDLYGDQLWIPTPKDSESAFSEFVEDVRAGRRQANSDIVIENGRVQVVGALGVMEINGILCRKIFDRNKRWHDFFVEESYVIPWMYPYLTPHGLIMKINPERAPLSRENTDDDMDFWDWYVRRMTRDARYRRDIVAQKSFSKLRSAIAGLYMNRGRAADAERAYNDARVLYPVSPEATFRYVQDILMRQRRYSEALEAIDYFSLKDPNNERGPYVAGVIRDIMKTEDRLSELLRRSPSSASPSPDSRAPSRVSPTSLADDLEIAELFLKLGNPGMARESAAPLVSRPDLTVADCLRLARILGEAEDFGSAARAMSRIWRKDSVRRSPEAMRLAVHIFQSAGDMAKLAEVLPAYLRLKPDDWQSWLSLAALEALRGKTDEAVAAMEKAVTYGGDKVLPVIEKSQTLLPVFEQFIRRRRASPQRAAGAAAPPLGLPGFGG